MDRTLKTAGAAALVATAAAPIAHLLGGIDLPTCKVAMLLATLVWFAAAGYASFGRTPAEEAAG